MNQPPSDPQLLSRRKLVVIPLVLMTFVAAIYVFDYTTPAYNTPSDAVSESERFVRAQAYAGLKPSEFSPIAPQKLPETITAMGLNKPDQAALEQSVAKGIRLISVTLYDSDAQDGDVVAITSDGFSRTIALQKEPVRVVIPEPRFGSFTLTGAVDGEGGGVTVGLMLSTEPFPLPVMSVGQALAIPVRNELGR